MTLGEGKARVWQLLDEWSSGGVRTQDEDIALKMNRFFDMAQKHMAQVRHIRKSAVVQREEGETWYPLPGDLLKLVAVWKGDRRWRSCRVRGGMLYIPEGVTEAVSVEYFALPADITEDTPDETAFQVREEAANALPFFVAAQQLITDLVIDYAGLYAIYNQMAALLSEQEAMEGAAGGGGTLRNTVFR